MRLHIVILTFLFCFSLLFGDLKKDSLLNYRIGIIGGANLVSNKSEIPVIPDNKLCGLYKRGKNNSFWGGLVFSYNAYNKYIWIDSRLYFDSRPAYLTSNSNNYEVYDEISDSYQILEFKNEFSSELDYLIFDFGLKSFPLSEFPLYFRIGLDIGNPLFKSNFSNSQIIIKPDNVLFPDDTKKKILDNGNLDNVNTALGTSLSIGADIELRGNLNFTPEISYRYGLNSIISNTEWNQNIFRVNFGLSWNIHKKEEIRPIPKDTIIPIKKEKNKEIVINKTPIIKNIDASNLNLRETVVTQTYPILPYIFYDSADFKLRNKYIFENKLSDEENLTKNSLEIYYRLIDIIGIRMNRNPEYTLEVKGYTDGKELNSYSNRIELAKKRANSFVDYISNKYNIERNRFLIKSENIPDNISNTEYIEGFQENRRIELYSDNPKLLEPVIHSKFLEYELSNSQIIVHSEFTQAENIDLIKISLNHNNSVIYQKSYIDNSGIYKIAITPSVKRKIMKHKDNISLSMTIFSDNKISDSKTIKINTKSQKDKFETGRLNLIVFDFDKSDISDINKNMISDFINSNIQANSQVSITGSTDKLGEAKYNKQLSLKRAKSVEQYILDRKQNLNITEVKGVGSSNLLFDNNLPEGRFYCRTVLIQVKTKIPE